jgi:hypothetical protein
MQSEYSSAWFCRVSKKFSAKSSGFKSCRGMRKSPNGRKVDLASQNTAVKNDTIIQDLAVGKGNLGRKLIPNCSLNHLIHADG